MVPVPGSGDDSPPLGHPQAAVLRAAMLPTRATQRLLTLRGLASGEATNLTAWLCGIPVADQHWQLREINRLLFVRELRRRGHFGPLDGETH